MKYFVWTILIILLIVVLPHNVFAALININTATVQELEGLTGVGTVIADRIVEYRNSNGPFKTIEEIKNVKGIGDVNFLKMKDQITVGETLSLDPSSVVETTDNNQPGEEIDNNARDNSSGNGSTVISVHSSQTDLSTTVEKLSWEISAGRGRRALVDTAVIFEAKTVKGEPAGFKSFSWSFGDGATYSGRDVSHSYRFPGTYQVVVNGRSDDEAAVARTTVVIESPKLKISWLDNGDYAAKLKNDQSQEINLGGFRIVSGSTTLLIIPHDTIVAGGGEVAMPLSGAYTFRGLIGGDLTLYSPAGTAVTSWPNLEVAEVLPAQNNLAAVTMYVSPVKIKAPVAVEATSTATDTAIELVAPENIGWWRRIVSWLRL